MSINARAYLSLGVCMCVAACSSNDLPFSPQTGGGGSSGTGSVGGMGSGGSLGGTGPGGSMGGMGPGGSGGCTGDADCASLSIDCHKGLCLEGQCVQGLEIDGTPCDDGEFCTGSDACLSGACKGGPTTCPSDRQPCHVPSCDEVSQLCTIDVAIDGTPCGDPCTVNGTCSAGSCNTGVPPDCSAFTGECTIGVCDPQQGCKAMAVNQGAPCNDGDPCTAGDQCDTGACKPGALPACGPVDGCCPANCSVVNDGDCSNTFELTQSVDGKTLTCLFVGNQVAYSECNQPKVDGLYFYNDLMMSGGYSMQPSILTDFAGFCQTITGSPVFEAYYDSDVTLDRVTWMNHVWGLVPSSQWYVQHLRCYY